MPEKMGFVVGLRINNVDGLLPHQWAVKNSAVENNG